jgi:hypothetical protein
MSIPPGNVTVGNIRAPATLAMRVSAGYATRNPGRKVKLVNRRVWPVKRAPPSAKRSLTLPPWPVAQGGGAEYRSAQA